VAYFFGPPCLVQLSLTVTQKVIFLPFSVPRIVSNIVRIVCTGTGTNLKVGGGQTSEIFFGPAPPLFWL